jgi:predicted nuclease with TOPRIM domain
LLSFIGEYAGFERVKILRLQESPELREKIDVNLADVLGGVSPDYSIVAQKAGSKNNMSALDQAFANNYGLTSSDLANRYEESRQRVLAEANQAKAATENELSAVREVIQTDLAEVHRRLEQTMGELGAARAEKEALGAEREAVKAELAEVRGRLEQAAGELGAARVEKDALGAEREGIKAELAEVRGRLEQMAAELGAARSERDALEAALENERFFVQQAVSERDALSSEEETTASLLQQANEKLATAQQELHQLHQANHHHHQLAQERQQRIDDLLHSTSWRITSPLRKVKRAALVFTAPDGRPTFAYVGKHAKLYIEQRPGLRKATSFLSPGPTQTPASTRDYLSQPPTSGADKNGPSVKAWKMSISSWLGEALLVAKDRIDANPGLRRFVLRLLERFPGLKFRLRRRYLAKRAGVAGSVDSLNGREAFETSWKQGQSEEPLSATPTNLELIIARERMRVAGASMEGGTPLQRYIWKTEKP